MAIYEKNAQTTFTDIVNDIGNYFSNRRIPTDDARTEAAKTITNAPIRLEHLQIINGLPPLYDNIVDPPIEYSSDDYQYKLTTLFSKNRSSLASVGRAYVKNVLASGNYLTLVPLELNTSLISSINSATNTNIGTVIQQGLESLKQSITGEMSAGGSKSPTAIWQRFNDVIDIGAFGYTSKVASKRYWRHVAANMKVVLYALGIDTRQKNGEWEDPEVRNTMPDWILDNLSSNKFIDRWSLLIDDSSTTSGPSGETDKKAVETYQSKIEESKKARKEELAGIRSETAKSSDQLKAEAERVLNAATRNEDVKDYVRTLTEDSFYDKESISKLKSWILATSDSTDTVEQNLPFVSFYVNGIIEKNMSASQSVGDSELGTILASKFLAGFAKGMAKKVSEGFSSSLSGLTDSTEALAKEMSYTGNTDALGYFSEGYIPRINKGVEGEMSYSISIRSLADGSDPISIASHCMYTLALLMPFYIEPTHKSYKQAFVPKAPLVCSAFCKGVFNVPRGCISSIDIKTDPVFQTTESVSTDIEITVTLVPFINKGFSPDFGATFNAAADETHLITALFNPFSSLNVLVTMCGMNTTMTKINKGIFEYFFLKRPSALVNIAFESWEGFKSNFVDLSSTTIRHLGLANVVKPI